MTIGVWITPLSQLPKGYGVAWHSAGSFHAYCLPVPLNRIAGAFRAWYLDWRRPVEDDPVLQAYTYGHARGYNEGRTAGYQQAFSHIQIVKDEIKVIRDSIN